MLVVVVFVVLKWCLYVGGGGVCGAKFYFMGCQSLLLCLRLPFQEKKHHPDLSLTLCYTE